MPGFQPAHRSAILPMGAMQALAPDRVVFAGSTSKTLAPGMRLGWLVVPAALRRPLLEAMAEVGAAGAAGLHALLPVDSAERERALIARGRRVGATCTGCTPTATGGSPAGINPPR